jgi:chromate transporter
MPTPESHPDRLVEVAQVALKLGFTAFGGPAAHIAMLREETVVRRQWLTDAYFLDLVGATNLIPGPNSTEMVIHVGHLRAGWRGLLVAGTLFILPAATIVLALGWAYVQFGTTPAGEALLYGIKPVVIAVVAQALWGLGRTALQGPLLFAVGAAAAALYLVGFNELAILYGSGYVLLAFLRNDFVERLGWLTDQQLLDAVAIGQMTPGPVFTTATFIGYLVAGVPGAVLATVGIFLPAFIFVALLHPLVPSLRRYPWTAAMLDGVNVAAMGLMAAVTWLLGRDAIVDPITATIAIAAAALLIRFRVNSTWLVLAGAIVGLTVSQLR